MKKKAKNNNYGEHVNIYLKEMIQYALKRCNNIDKEKIPKNYDYELLFSKSLWPLFTGMVHLPKGYHAITSYFSPSSSHKFLVFSLSTLEGLEGESTMEPNWGTLIFIVIMIICQ